MKGGRVFSTTISMANGARDKCDGVLGNKI